MERGETETVQQYRYCEGKRFVVPFRKSTEGNIAMDDSLFVQITDLSNKMVAARSGKILESRCAGVFSHSAHSGMNAYNVDVSKSADKTPSVRILALFTAAKFRCKANDQLSNCFSI